MLLYFQLWCVSFIILLYQSFAAISLFNQRSAWVTNYVRNYNSPAISTIAGSGNRSYERVCSEDFTIPMIPTSTEVGTHRLYFPSYSESLSIFSSPPFSADGFDEKFPDLVDAHVEIFPSASGITNLSFFQPSEDNLCFDRLKSLAGIREYYSETSALSDTLACRIDSSYKLSCSGILCGDWRSTSTNSVYRGNGRNRKWKSFGVAGTTVSNSPISVKIANTLTSSITNMTALIDKTLTINTDGGCGIVELPSGRHDIECFGLVKTGSFGCDTETYPINLTQCPIWEDSLEYDIPRISPVIFQRLDWITISASPGIATFCGTAIDPLNDKIYGLCFGDLRDILNLHQFPQTDRCHVMQVVEPEQVLLYGAFDPYTVSQRRLQVVSNYSHTRDLSYCGRPATWLLLKTTGAQIYGIDSRFRPHFGAIDGFHGQLQISSSHDRAIDVSLDYYTACYISINSQNKLMCAGSMSILTGDLSHPIRESYPHFVSFQPAASYSQMEPQVAPESDRPMRLHSSSSYTCSDSTTFRQNCWGGIPTRLQHYRPGVFGIAVVHFNTTSGVASAMCLGSASNQMLDSLALRYFHDVLLPMITSSELRSSDFSSQPRNQAFDTNRVPDMPMADQIQTSPIVGRRLHSYPMITSGGDSFLFRISSAGSEFRNVVPSENSLAFDVSVLFSQIRQMSLAAAINEAQSFVGLYSRRLEDDFASNARDKIPKTSQVPNLSAVSWMYDVDNGSRSLATLRGRKHTSTSINSQEYTDTPQPVVSADNPHRQSSSVLPHSDKLSSSRRLSHFSNTFIREFLDRPLPSDHAPNAPFSDHLVREVKDLNAMAPFNGDYTVGSSLLTNEKYYTHLAYLDSYYGPMSSAASDGTPESRLALTNDATQKLNARRAAVPSLVPDLISLPVLIYTSSGRGAELEMSYTPTATYTRTFTSSATASASLTSTATSTHTRHSSATYTSTSSSSPLISPSSGSSPDKAFRTATATQIRDDESGSPSAAPQLWMIEADQGSLKGVEIAGIVLSSIVVAALVWALLIAPALQRRRIVVPGSITLDSQSDTESVTPASPHNIFSPNFDFQSNSLPSAVHERNLSSYSSPHIRVTVLRNPNAVV